MKLKALKNIIIVEKPENKEHTKNGLFIASKNPPTMQAKVVSVGKGTYSDDGKWHPNTIEEGQTILFSKGSGENVEFEGKNYIFFKPEDILAIIKNG